MKKKQIATTKWKPATWDTNGPIVYSGSPDGSDPTCDKTNYYPIIGHCNPTPLENPPTAENVAVFTTILVVPLGLVSLLNVRRINAILIPSHV